MPIYTPPHPGEFIREVYLSPSSISGRQLAAKLRIPPRTLRSIEHYGEVDPINWTAR